MTKNQPLKCVQTIFKVSAIGLVSFFFVFLFCSRSASASSYIDINNLAQIWCANSADTWANMRTFNCTTKYSSRHDAGYWGTNGVANGVNYTAGANHRIYRDFFDLTIPNVDWTQKTAEFYLHLDSAYSAFYGSDNTQYIGLYAASSTSVAYACDNVYPTACEDYQVLWDAFNQVLADKIADLELVIDSTVGASSTWQHFHLNQKGLNFLNKYKGSTITFGLLAEPDTGNYEPAANQYGHIGWNDPWHDASSIQRIYLKYDDAPAPPVIPFYSFPSYQKDCQDVFHFEIDIASTSIPNEYFAIMGNDGDNCATSTFSYTGPGVMGGTFLDKPQNVIGVFNRNLWPANGGEANVCVVFQNQITGKYDYASSSHVFVYPQTSSFCTGIYGDLGLPGYPTGGGGGGGGWGGSGNIGFCDLPCQGLATSTNPLDFDNFICGLYKFGCFVVKPSPVAVSNLMGQFNALTGKFPLAPFTELYGDLTIAASSSASSTSGIIAGQIAIPFYSTSSKQYQAQNYNISPNASTTNSVMWIKFRRFEVLAMWALLCVLPIIALLTYLIL